MTIEAFSEERFPLRVSFGTSGGPERRTEIVRLSTGFEHRNQRHRHSARRYDAGSGVRSLGDLVAVVDFFEARRGRLTGFRFRDPLDFASSAHGVVPGSHDQRIGVGDGTRTEFELTKTYGTGKGAYLRPIVKPVPGSVSVALDGVEQNAGFSVDPVSGLVNFETPPGEGVSVSAGFLFDVPVRFDIDQISVSVAGFEAGEIPTIPLVEVRP